MRVLLDTSYAARGMSGTAVYIERLAAALEGLDGIELIQARQPRRLRRGGRNPLRSAVNAALDWLWLHRGLPRAAREARVDVVHHPAPAYSSRIAAAQVATVLDLAFLRHPEGYGRVWRLLAKRSYESAASNCGALVCISETVAGEVDAERVVVARLGPGQELPEVERRGEPRHFLYVGDDERRKNVDGLVAAYERYRAAAGRPLELVLAGAAARRGGGEISPTPARLAELHAGAAALVHPALDEGFGLTLVEAMTAGTPVIAVRTPAAAEVCGDAALLVGPDDLEDAMTRVAADPDLRERLSAAGRRRSADFSWDESARLHETAYTLALE
jgi:glycosyltransferase involved in cell wall biosynthesis